MNTKIITVHLSFTSSNKESRYVKKEKKPKKQRNIYFETIDVNRKLYHALLRRGLNLRLPIHPRRRHDYGNIPK